MRILIVAVGAYGDVAPMVAVGARLATEGHDVAVAAYELYADTITGAGMEFRPLYGDPRAMGESAEGQDWQRGGAGPLAALRLLRTVATDMRRTNEGILGAARLGADLMLLSPSAIAGYPVAQALGIPSMGLYLQPQHATGDFPPMAFSGVTWLGRWGNRAALRLVRAGSSPLFSGMLKQIAAAAGQPPLSLGGLYRQQDRRRWPVFYGFSPVVVPRPVEWRAGVDIAGYWWPARPAGWQPPTDLVAFLNDGPAPVFFGFGSMGSAQAGPLAAVIGPALTRAGLRGVVQSGWAGLEVNGDNVITVDYVPHDWLFPRMAAVVHHGGAGTTGAGLRAGVPAIAVPMIVDQPFWASRLTALGVSPAAIPVKRLTVERLAAALTEAVSDPTYRENSAKIAATLAAEDGIGRLVDAVTDLKGT
jgi:sterol 3beta-glucosyltransferase